MAKQLNIDLNVRANTDQAKRAMMELQQSLTKVAGSFASSGGKGMDTQLKAAAQAAQQLSHHLSVAYNADTGKINLNKFSASLKSANTDLKTLSSTLLATGANGQQAFVQLAQTIAAAERPVVSLNSKLTSLWTVLKNTARWQISSTILHGFMGTIQQAYGYAQDLNKSLTDIGIVTGYNTERMAAFAIEANKAAKSLSTTTNEYAKGSLIYFQQGLGDADVKARTDATVKMANVTGQSMEQTSNQLTAIWNNFAKGSTELELFADKITALGAATASSSAEISEGLNQFAAVANTVGLSYDYATAALATVVATTRQSANVVGTAFKTLFARIEGLKLGETLEDGTDLNKYSEALMAVGVNIKEANGEMKDMDRILDEIGAKWETLAKDQQIALAQAVAGVRQYTQFIALMDHWDFMQDNLETVEGAVGTLQKQQERYAESWEAANKRLRASTEAIFTDLIDDKFFIKLTNGFAQVVDGIHDFIEGIGGAKTLFIGLGSIILSTVAQKIEPALRSMVVNIRTMFQTPQQQAAQQQAMMNSIMQTAQQATGIDPKTFNLAEQKALENAQQLSMVKSRLTAVSKDLTDIEKAQYEQQVMLVEKAGERVNKIYETITALQEENNELQKNIDISNRSKVLWEEEVNSINSLKEAIRQERVEISQANLTKNEAQERTQILAEKEKELAQQQQQLASWQKASNEILQTLAKEYTNLVQNGKNLEQSTISIKNVFTQFLPSAEKVDAAFNNIGKADNKTGLQNLKRLFTDTFNNISKVLETVPPEVKKAYDALMQLSTKDVRKQNIEEYRNAIKNLIQTITEVKIPANQVKDIFASFKASPEWNKLDANTQKLIETMLKGKEALQGFQQGINGINPEHAIKPLEAITRLAASAGSLAMVLSSIKSLWTTLTNPDASGWEKFGTVLMSLSMIVPSVITGFNSFKTAMQGLEAAAAQTLLTNEFMTASTIAYTEAKKEADFYDLLDIEQRQKDIALQLIKQRLQTIGIVQSEEEALALLEREEVQKLLNNALAKEIGVRGIKTPIQKINILDTIKESAAIKLLRTQIEALTLEFTIITAAAVAFVVVMALIAKRVGELEGLENKIKRAGEATEYFQTKTKEADEELNNLVSTFDRYKSAKETLQSLSTGTQEFADALRDANQAASDLIKNYNLTANDYKVDVNGLIQIDKGSLELAQANVETQIVQNEIKAANSAAYEQSLQEDKIFSDFLIQMSSLGYNGVIGAQDKDILLSSMANGTFAQNKQSLEQLGFSKEMQRMLLAATPEIIDTIQQTVSNRATVESDERLAQLKYLENNEKYNRGSEKVKNAMAAVSTREAVQGQDERANKLLNQWSGETNPQIQAYLRKNGYEEAEVTGFGPFRGIKLSKDSETTSSMEEVANQMASIQDYSFLDDINDNNADIYQKIADKNIEALTGAELHAIENNDTLNKYFSDIFGDSALVEQFKARNNLTINKEENGMSESKKVRLNSDESILDYKNANWNDIDETGHLIQKEETKEDRKAAIPGKIQEETYGAELDVARVEEMANAYAEYNDKLVENGATMKSDAEAATDAARRNVRLNDAVDDLAKNYDNYNSVLQDLAKAQSDTDKMSIKSSESAKKLKTSIAGLLDTSEELVDIDILDKISPEDLEEAASGSEEAIGKIRNAFIDMAAEEYGVTEGIDEFKSHMDELDEGMVIDLNNEPFLLKLIETMVAAGSSAEDIEAMLSGFSIDADVTSFEGAMENLKGAAVSAAETTESAGEAIVGNMSFDAKTNTLTVANTNTKEDVGFKETITRDVVTSEGDQVAETGLFGIINPKPITQQLTGFTKTVTPESVGEDSTDTQSVTGVQISNAHKSSGGKVGSSHKNQQLGKGGGGKGGKGGGGSGGKTQTRSRSVTKPTVRRYSVVQNNVDSINKQLDLLGKNKDRVWGKSQIDIMDQEIDRLGKLKDGYKDFAKEIAGENWDKLYAKMRNGQALTREDIENAGGYLGEDFRKLISGTQYQFISKHKDQDDQKITRELGSIEERLGIAFQIGANGLIANTDELYDANDAQLEAAKDLYEGLDDDASKDALAEAQAVHDAIETAIQQSQETGQKSWENLENMLQAEFNRQDKIIEQIDTKLKNGIDISERTLKRLEYTGKILGDSVYKSAELMKTWWSNGQGRDSWTEAQREWGYTQEAYNSLQSRLASGEFADNFSGYLNELRELQSQGYNIIDQLLELDEKNRTYYSEVIEKANEEMAKLTDEIAHNSSVLEHMQNVLSLLGRSMDYEAIGTLLKGQRDIAKSQMDVSTSQYQSAKAAFDRVEAEYKANVAGWSEDQIRYFEESMLEPARKRLNEAYDRMYEDTEAFLEKVRAVFDNTLNQIMKESEDAFTNGLGWDYVNDSMALANSIQDEYLTKTNQIYETNDLMRKLARDIDKTESAAAKAKLKNFSDEIAAMQQQEKLTQTDLEIAKARYELLQAEMALEDAKNAKSIVRLQRDNEGNYGYVYTADQGAIDEAEDNWANKQNDLYNLVLGKTNEYNQKIIQATKERDEALRALSEEYADKDIEHNEEYQQKKQQILDYYSQIIYADQESLNSALFWLGETAATDTNEAWSQSFSDIVDKCLDYEDIVMTTNENLDNNMQQLNDSREEISSEVKNDLDDIKKKTDDLTTSSDEYAKKIQNELLPKLNQEIEQIEASTLAYINKRQAVIDLMNAIMDLNEEIDNNLDKQAGLDDNIDKSQMMADNMDNPEEWKKWGALRGEDVGNNISTAYIEDVLTWANRGDPDAKAIAQRVRDKTMTWEESIRRSGHYKAKYGLATGGYTGDWSGNDGKLALLHQKELVLNAEDTKNILSSVSMIRQIADMIDLRAAAQNLTSGLLAPLFQSSASNEMNQNVTITAEFPNVTDRGEIEAAFDNLINRASQFAGRWGN